MSKYATFGRFIDRCESPIERFFLASLLFFGDHTFEPFEHDRVIARDATGLELGMQVPCGPYRIDFTLTMPGKAPMFAIELDGRAFHGKTAQQFDRDAARGRELTGFGWTLLRFTGGELTRDPRRFALEAMRRAAVLVDGIAHCDVKPANVQIERPVDPALAPIYARIAKAELDGDWEAQCAAAREVEDAVRKRMGGGR